MKQVAVHVQWLSGGNKELAPFLHPRRVEYCSVKLTLVLGFTVAQLIGEQM